MEYRGSEVLGGGVECPLYIKAGWWSRGVHYIRQGGPLYKVYIISYRIN